MDREIREIEVTNENYTKLQERAARLAASINNLKERGIVVSAHEPIEGKMTWSENV